MKKHIYLMFLLLLSINIPLLAAPCEHGIFKQGDGTKSSPWKVSTPTQLNHLRDHTRSNFELTNNIDLTGDIGKYWERIPEFRGDINGNGYTISNFGTPNSSAVDMKGFIGNFYGTLSNLNIDGMYIHNKPPVSSDPDSKDRVVLGGIVGINGGTIVNCTLKNFGTFWSSNTVGGIAGHNNGTIAYCTNYAYINSTYTAGGIAAGNNGVVAYCENYGKVGSSGPADTGGIVGVNSNKVIGCANFGKVDSHATDGGIVGILHENALVKDCYNAGDNLFVVGDYWGWGGIIENCYNIYALEIKDSKYSSITKPGKHTVINSYNGSPYLKDDDYGMWNELYSFMISDALVEKLNAGREPAVWVKGDKDYPYPKLVGHMVNDISIPNTRLGDNTNLIINAHVVTPKASWELVDLNSGKVLASTGQLSEVNKTYTIDLSNFNGDMKLVSRLRNSSGVLYQSPVFTINKIDVLNHSLSALLNEKGMAKILIFNDTDRYFENNTANQKLVQEIQKRANGKVLIYNNVSPVLQPLIER